MFVEIGSHILVLGHFYSLVRKPKVFDRFKHFPSYYTIQINYLAKILEAHPPNKLFSFSPLLTSSHLYFSPFIPLRAFWVFASGRQERVANSKISDKLNGSWAVVLTKLSNSFNWFINTFLTSASYFLSSLLVPLMWFANWLTEVKALEYVSSLASTSEMEASVSL